MLKKHFRNILRKLGYELLVIEGMDPKLEKELIARRQFPGVAPDSFEPVWPLPRIGVDWSDEEIRKRFDEFPFWHYPFSFEGGLGFSTQHSGVTDLADVPERPAQRFRHFMPYLMAANGESLKGKRVLDIACNSGFWSIQCALLGADVVGFDARQDLIDQANLIKKIVGVEKVDFQVMDFWDMNPDTLGGKFDIVLNLGVLYHLPKPHEALEATMKMSKKHILLDTGILRSEMPLVRYRWEEPYDIRMAVEAGVVANPSSSAIDLLLLHLGAKQWMQIPMRSTDAMPDDYQDGFRASWLIEVSQ